MPMRIARTTTAMLMLAANLAQAQTLAPGTAGQDHGAHHPGAAASSAPAAPNPAAPGSAPPAAGGHGRMGGGMMGGGMMGPGHMDRMMSHMREMHGMRAMPMGPGPMALLPTRHVEGRVAFLKAELGITESQATAWNGFADAMRGAAKTMQAVMARPDQVSPPATMPERADAMLAMMAARQEAMTPVVRAAKTLYATLGDAQKKIADELLLPPMGGMR